ncbi:hypothetical protein EMIT0P74_140106 [Pseudomonas sp. IT-P74]
MSVRRSDRPPRHKESFRTQTLITNPQHGSFPDWRVNA